MSDKTDLDYLLGGWLKTIDHAGVDFVSHMADMIISIEHVTPAQSIPIQITQAKGRALRQPVNPRFTQFFKFELTYKRRHKRQTHKEFPFMVIASNTPDGFHSAAKDWCIEACGNQGWDTDWKAAGFRYYFRNKAHATLFILRFKGWSPE